MDLSSYEQRFSAPSGCIGGIQDVMELTLQQFPFQDFMYRYENDPIAVLYLDNPVVPAPVPVPANIDEITPIAQYIAGEMNTNAHGDEAKKILGLNTYSEKECMNQYRNQAWFTRLLNTDMAIQCSENSFNFPRAALLAWTLNVRQGARWDHKPIIEKKFHPRDPEKQQLRAYKNYVYFYDVWSNMHYGYVGTAAGLSEAALLDGAGLEQIGSTWLRGEISKKFTQEPEVRSFDDLADREAIEIGMKLYKNYPPTYASSK